MVASNKKNRTSKKGGTEITKLTNLPKDFMVELNKTTLGGIFEYNGVKYQKKKNGHFSTVKTGGRKTKKQRKLRKTKKSKNSKK